MDEKENEDPVERKRRKHRERQTRWLAKQRQESIDKLCAAQSACNQRRIENDTQHESQLRRSAETQSHSLCIKCHQNPEQSKEKHHAAEEHLSQMIHYKTIHFEEDQVQAHDCSELTSSANTVAQKTFQMNVHLMENLTVVVEKEKLSFQSQDVNGVHLDYPDFLYIELLSDARPSPTNEIYISVNTYVPTTERRIICIVAVSTCRG